MRDALAERLLAEVMGWNPQDVAAERPALQALATYKYDEYQQFSPGMRFVESLALWLAQFESREERQLAYNFVRSRLAFVSRAEMAHLVAMAFPDVVRPLLLRIAADELGYPHWLVGTTVRSARFRILLRQSLFLGLSDGARIDQFRRSTSELSNEQVWQTYEISDSKASDLLGKLERELKPLFDGPPPEAEKRFRVVFLLDDFSASGISYMRKEGENGEYAGKIARVLRDTADSNKPICRLLDPRGVQICVLIYLITAYARGRIEGMVHEWYRGRGLEPHARVLAVHTLEDNFRVRGDDNEQISALLKRYFDEGIMDEHYQKGRHDLPYLGFDQCGLPLVLSHNTPNNSLPLLWFEETRRYRGLFPRASRHRSQL